MKPRRSATRRRDVDQEGANRHAGPTDARTGSTPPPRSRWGHTADALAFAKRRLRAGPRESRPQLPDAPDHYEAASTGYRAGSAAALTPRVAGRQLYLSCAPKRMKLMKPQHVTAGPCLMTLSPRPPAPGRWLSRPDTMGLDARALSGCRQSAQPTPASRRQLGEVAGADRRSPQAVPQTSDQCRHEKRERPSSRVNWKISRTAGARRRTQLPTHARASRYRGVPRRWHHACRRSPNGFASATFIVRTIQPEPASAGHLHSA
jgi:hypothetical protein